MKFTVGPFEVRTCDAPLAKGEKRPYHRHNFDHVTYCARGALAMRKLADEKTPAGDRREGYAYAFVEEAWHLVVSEQRIRAGTMMNSHTLVAGGLLHELEALEDGTIYHCQYPHLDWDGNIVERYDGNEAAYV